MRKKYAPGKRKGKMTLTLSPLHAEVAQEERKTIMDVCKKAETDQSSLHEISIALDDVELATFVSVSFL